MKLVIFDMGGVVCENADVVPFIAAHLEISEDRFYELAGQMNLKLLFCGLISEGEFWERFSRNYGRTVNQDLWKIFFHPRLNGEVVELIEPLRYNSRVVVGTNTIDSHYVSLIAMRCYEPFDALYASNKMGVAKPSPEFYRRILTAESYTPDETLLIDDSEENVASARAIGLHGILFSNADDLRSQLTGSGLLTEVP